MFYAKKTKTVRYCNINELIDNQSNQLAFWMTIYTADAENWEEMLGTALREMLFYGIFLIILTIRKTTLSVPLCVFPGVFL